MKDLFIPFKEALALKELGFNEPCLAKWELLIVGDTIPNFSENYESEGLWFKHNSKDVSHTNGYAKGINFLWSAPLYSQVFKWFREKHKLFISIEYSTTNQTDFVITINKKSYNDARDEEYKTYEEAELASLKQLIRLTKNK